jgi:segregation and condensation protein B
MESPDASKALGTVTERNTSEDELAEAVTTLRDSRGPKVRDGKRSRKVENRQAESSFPKELAMDSGVADLRADLPPEVLASGQAPGFEPSAAGEPMESTGLSDTSDQEIDQIDPREVVPILEALVFVSHDPLSVERAMASLGLSKTEVIQAFRQLQHDYDREGRGLQLVEVAGGYRIVTRPEYAPWLKRLEKTRPAPKLSRSALESLAIIAYKQPVVRGEIEQIRGVETSGVLRTLLERKLVRMVGRKEVPGRPIMYGTTKYFLEHFGLKDLSELPPLREFSELGESEQAFLPVDDELLSVSHGDAVANSPSTAEGPSEEAMMAAEPR